MRPSAAQLLDAWESGLAAGPAQRALLLLSAAQPDADPAGLAQSSLAQRDSSLLSLREWAYGSYLSGLADCPRCGEQLEVDFEVGDVECAASSRPETFTVAAGDYQVEVRLPDSWDLIASGRSANLDEARDCLRDRCLVSARHNGRTIPPAHMPPQVLDTVVAELADACAQADVQLELACPDCGHEWQCEFDIAAYLWSEIDAWSQRLLQDVSALAGAYGWSERDILTMSPWRRSRYLEVAR